MPGVLGVLVVVVTATLGPATSVNAFNPTYGTKDEGLANKKTTEKFVFDASDQESLNIEILSLVKDKLVEIENAKDSKEVESAIQKKAEGTLAYAKKQATDIGKVKKVVQDTSNGAKVTGTKTYSASGGIMAEMTAYSSSPDETSGNPFITASGKRVHWGTAASNRYAFGTRFKIPSMYGDKVFIVEDRGGFGHHFDLWFPSKAKAIQFGRRHAKVIFL